MRLVPFLLTFFLLFIVFNRRGFCGREAALVAVVAFGVLIAGLTEGLSLFHLLTPSGVLISWSVIALAVGAWLLLKPGCAATGGEPAAIPTPAKLFLGAAALIYIVLFVQAICIPPNSWDGMTYHLSRIEHWVQNQTVAYFPTNVVRQNSYPPFPEWAILHVRLLIGHDRDANMIQFAAMTASMVGVSLIARLLGAAIVGQSFAVLAAMCLPMGILQATSVQTDYVVALWLVCFVYFLLTAMRQPGVKYPVLAALSMGLACLSKGYSYAYVLPFLVWWVAARQSRSMPQRLLIALSMLGTALIMSAGFFYRNMDAFHKIVYSREQLTNTVYGLKIYIANLLRFAGLHLMTPVASINDLATKVIERIAKILHIELNPLSASFGAGKFELPPHAFNEDYAGNLLACVVFIVLLFIAIRKTRGRAKVAGGIHWPFIACLCAMFLILSLVMRFQPFATRFHLAIFVLGSAWVGWAMERFCSRRWMVIAAAALWLGALPWLVLNSNKPIIGQHSFVRKQLIDQYFHIDPLLKEHYQGAAAHLDQSGCKDIALKIGEDNKEYLLWVALHERGLRDIRVEHIHITNPTASLKYPRGPFKPCAILSHAVQNPPVLDIPEGLFFRTWILDREKGNARHTAIYISLEQWGGRLYEE